MARALALLPLVTACAAVPAAPIPVTGEWGGTHVALHLTAAGGTLDYDCARGTIAPVVPSTQGRFAADGTHTPEHGGPVRQGEVLPTLRVQFTGNLAGDRMTLEGRAANGVALGPFELRRGAQPAIFRCL